MLSDHAIASDRPAPDFFAGALLGNGGLGVVVCTRPDAVVLRLGHNAVWDIRTAERHRDQVGTFREVFGRVERLSREGKKLSEDPWFAEYCRLMVENYARVYPRPFPCGSIVLSFDRRHTELLGHRLDLASGVCDVFLLRANVRVTLRIFVDMTEDRVWLRMQDPEGRDAESPFDRVHLMPHTEKEEDPPPRTGPEGPSVVVPPLPGPTVLPVPGGKGLAFHQRLPFEEIPARTGIPHPLDRAIRVGFASTATLAMDSRPGVTGEPVHSGILDRGMGPAPAFLACVRVDQGLFSAVPAEPVVLSPDTPALEAAARNSSRVWEDHWSRSAVVLDDDVPHGCLLSFGFGERSQTTVSRDSSEQNRSRKENVPPKPIFVDGVHNIGIV